jgi:hypothetical protein
MKNFLYAIGTIFIVCSTFSAQQLEINKQKTINIDVYDEYVSIHSFEDGYIAFGYTVPLGESSIDLHIIHLDQDFNIINDKTLGSLDNEISPQAIVENDTIFIALSSRGSSTGDLTFDNYGWDDIWFLALDFNFNILYQNLYGGEGGDKVKGLIRLRNSNFLILSESTSGISGNKTVGKIETIHVHDPWLIEVKSNSGEIVRQQAITNDNDAETGYSLTQSQNTGNIYVGISVSSNNNNYFNSQLFGNSDFMLTVFNENLEKINDKCFGGTEGGEGGRIFYHNNHLYMYGGSTSGVSGNKTSSNFGSGDAWLLKLDEDLNIIYDKNYGGTGNDSFDAIIFKDNKMVLGAYAYNSPISGNKTCLAYGLGDIWIMILDMEGNIIDQNSYGGSDWDIITSMLVNSNNDLVVASRSKSPISGNKTEASTDYDLWMLELETTTILNNKSIVSNKIKFDPYPNPFKNAVSFDFSKINEDVTIRIFSLDGKLVFEKEIHDQDVFVWEDETIHNQVLMYKIVGSSTNLSGKIVKE